MTSSKTTQATSTAVSDAAHTGNKQMMLLAAAQNKMHIGPIPPASEMERYAKINQELPERIMAMAERQAEHRQRLEADNAYRQSRQKLISSVFAFILALVIVGCAAWCISEGHNICGLAMIIGELTAFVGVFVYGRSSPKQ